MEFAFACDAQLRAHVSKDAMRDCATHYRGLQVAWAWFLTGAVALGAQARQAPDPSQSSKSLDELQRMVKTGRPEARAWAVRQAALRQDAEGDALVLRALQDPHAQVGDEALLAVAATTGGRVLAALEPLVRASDASVRARVAEALGRSEHPVRQAWLGHLVRDRDPEVVRCALSALLRRVEAGRAPEDRSTWVSWACPAAEGRDPVFAALGQRILHRLDPLQAQDIARRALAARDPQLRAASCSALQSATQVVALELARPLLEDPEAAVRMAAIATLGTLRHRSALTAMAERLEREAQPRLRHRLRVELARTLGVDAEFDTAAWLSRAREWRGDLSTSGGQTDVRPHTQAHFSGLPLVSDRIAFLVDLSGSMWSAKVGAHTRKELVDRALAAALESLPRGATVQLVPYTGTPIPWETRAVRADAAKLRQALDWFAKRHDNGPGDFLEAFEHVLADPEIDSVCVLTDGVPTGGERHDLGLIFDRLLDRNAPRQLAVDALLVDCPKGLTARWEAFCARTGGVVRRVRVEDLLPQAPTK